MASAMDMLSKRGCILAAPQSGAGKTLLTISLLSVLQNDKTILPLQAFKAGPDFIDPQFHSLFTQTASINLDIFLSKKKAIRQLFLNYSQNHSVIVEGVMGFYDSYDKEVSTYNLAKILKLPVLLFLSAEGQSHTLLAVLQGLLKFKKNNYIEGIILNYISSESHYQFLKKLIEKEFPQLTLYGYFSKNLENIKTIPSRHLGLDLDSLPDVKNYFSCYSKEICKYLDLNLLKKNYFSPILPNQIAKKTLYLLSVSKQRKKIKKHLCIVKDEAFSFIYYDNIKFLQEKFLKISFCSALQNQIISQDADILWIPGGYVETEKNYNQIMQAKDFLSSLKKFANSKQKKIYAECAGMLLLSKGIEVEGKFKKLAAIIPLHFILEKKRVRLGYYTTEENQKKIYGHAFHYSRPINLDKIKEEETIWYLQKDSSAKVEAGAWRFENIFVTYLHLYFRNSFSSIEKYF